VSPSHRSVGDGDNCPLYDHGPMIVVPGSHPPKQYCPDQMHDGTTGKDGAPASRQFWPLYGFDDSVKAYLARLDKAIREAGLPDLSDVEVK
jgi:hypothetical protein